MTFLPNLTISLRSPSFGYWENWLGKICCNITFRDPNLQLVEAPALQPSDITIDADQIQQMNNELAEAANMELPGDDEEFWGLDNFHWWNVINYLVFMCTLL